MARVYARGMLRLGPLVGGAGFGLLMWFLEAGQELTHMVPLMLGWLAVLTLQARDVDEELAGKADKDDDDDDEEEVLETTPV